jgi:hypothetical protein
MPLHVVVWLRFGLGANTLRDYAGKEGKEAKDDDEPFDEKVRLHSSMD